MSTSIPPETPAPWQIPMDLRLNLLALLSSDPAQPVTMTYDEFLQWVTEDTLAEWVKGKVIVTSPASAQHQQLAAFLADILAAYVSTRDMGIVLSAPFQMKLAHSGREPDVIFVAKAHLSRLRRTYLDGAADMVVEIVSPESIGRDRGDKFYEYQDAGIPEYWLIDPEKHRAEFYQLDAEGAYQLTLPDTSKRYRARIPEGFWLDVAWLWQQPLPAVEQIALTIAGEDYARFLIAQLRQQGYLPAPDHE